MSLCTRFSQAILVAPGRDHREIGDTPRRGIRERLSYTREAESFPRERLECEETLRWGRDDEIGFRDTKADCISPMVQNIASITQTLSPMQKKNVACITRTLYLPC